jgi:DNA-binding transcriptional LysR family regulator
MPMTSILDSRKLLAFVTLARLGSFTLAAQELSVTQSAVSHSIKSLEDELELRLVDRRGRHIRLTPPGKNLLVHAQRIIDGMQEARADLSTYTT